MIKVLCEDTLTYAQEFFQQATDLTLFSTGDLPEDALPEADCLLVRSTTRVDRQLIERAPKIKLVATATAGTDHIDKAALAECGIEFFSAAGCNAIAVAEYVVASLFHLHIESPEQLFAKSVGIVGAGNVGTALSNKLQALGIKFKLCDPPLQHAGDPRPFVGMDSIMACDIISLHVPLVDNGAHPTRNLIAANRLASLRDGQVLINACRGEVVDEAALKALLLSGKDFKTVLDVWQAEPNIDFSLIPHIDIATQHIAGHTVEGKARGTDMVYQKVMQYFGLPSQLSMWDFLPETSSFEVGAPSTQQALCQAVLEAYPIDNDDKLFRQQVVDAASFRYSRKNYGIRREFAAYEVSASNSVDSEAIYALGFRPKNN